MTYHEFVVPAEEELLQAVGVRSEPVDGEETVRQLEFATEAGDVLTLIYDVTGRSIRCRWRLRNVLVLDIFREGAARLVVHAERDVSRLVVEFTTDSLRGELVVQVLPNIRIDDSLLFA